MEEPVVQEIDPLPEGVPWYRGSTDFRPFVLSKVLSVSPLHTVLSHWHVELCTLVVEPSFFPSVSLHRYVPLVCLVHPHAMGRACHR